MITNQSFNNETVQCTLLQIIDKTFVYKQHQSADVDKQTIEI